MKKIYNAPIAKVHNLNTTQMMALSTNDNNNDPLGSSDIGSGDGKFTINANEQTETSTTLWDEQW